MKLEYVPGFNQEYLVSECGKVFSLKKDFKELIQHKNNKGYLRVDLYKNGQRSRFLVHRLIWLVFNGDIEDEMEIDHVNANKQINHLRNLQKLSSLDNKKKCHIDYPHLKNNLVNCSTDT